MYVPSSVDQEGAESAANLLLGVLPLLSPSPECAAAIKPFMCLYLFGSCDADNQLRQVSRADCVRLRDDVCAGPWEKISVARQGALPDCNTFEDQDSQCLGMNINVLAVFPSKRARKEGGRQKKTTATSKNLMHF